MSLRFTGLILLFLVNGPLASGQWDTDQFLFRSGIGPTGPKAGPKEKQNTRKINAEKKQNSEIANKPTPAEMTPKNIEKPRELSNSKNFSLQAMLGFQTFKVDGNLLPQNLTSGGLSGGVQLNLNFETFGDLGLSYRFVPELTFQNENYRGSLAQLHWDDLRVEYLFFREDLASVVQVGTVVGEMSWWGHSGTNTSNIAQINYLGAELLVHLNRNQRLSPVLKFQALPWFRSGPSRMQGLGYSVDYERYFTISDRRTLAVSLVYQQMNLKSADPQESQFNQRRLGLTLSYILSAE